MNARIGAIAGVVFAVLLFLSVAAADPLRHAGDAELLDWWSDGANRESLFISMYFRLLAVPFFLAFLVQLRSRLRASEGPDGWSGLVDALGFVFVAGLAVSAVSRGVLAQTISLDNEPVPGTDVLRYVTEDSLGVYSLVAMPAAAILVGLASLISLKAKAFAPWLGWLGLPIAGLSVVLVALQVGALATPLLLIWCFAASVCLFRSATIATNDVKFVDARQSASHAT